MKNKNITIEVLPLIKSSLENEMQLYCLNEVKSNFDNYLGPNVGVYS